ncbi:MAG: PRC-barrel domain-containing protein [Actinomycetota bacterium]
MTSEERLRELEEKYDGYKVYDNRGEKIGKVDDLFVDESDREEYVGVKMGFFGTKSTLIPMDIIRVNEAEKALEVAESKDRIKDAPSFDDDEDITPEYEERIRRHFGLESSRQTTSSPSGGEGSERSGARVSEPDEERELDRESDLRAGGASDAETEYAEGETRERPVSRTEETETVEEGGRTRVRRRIVREEIVEEGPEER